MRRRSRPGPAQLTAWRDLLTVHQRVTELLDRELRAAHDLDLASYDVLFQLHEGGGRRTMGDLAEAVLLSRPNCTRLVDRLTEAGLVRRERDPADARVRWALLTEAGRSALRRAAPTHLAGIERWFGRHVDAGLAAALRSASAAVLADLPPAPPARPAPAAAVAGAAPVSP
jgi:DNA-binding MarR family transcriptional regulator